ncbi:hypothetical protein GDO78_004394 [Eleutherodactylus coqui]|uniref:Uncharacterized protein n=1 Tax=Eleutherodactylus coqui TaxID=57060 RepID=A0A8J6ER69_ELECQ|nr:hypothetical protein GDO78_004394 [Eleutherodactylus coqui]
MSCSRQLGCLTAFVVFTINATVQVGFWHWILGGREDYSTSVAPLSRTGLWITLGKKQQNVVTTRQRYSPKFFHFDILVFIKTLRKLVKM